MSREEQAKLEIGVTDASPGVTWFLTILFLIMIVVVPAHQIIADAVATRRLPQAFEVVKLVPTASEVSEPLRSGGLASAFGSLQKTNNRILRDIIDYEETLKRESRLRRWAVPNVQYVLTGLLKGGNEEAYCGREGWLFYRADLDYVTGRGFLDAQVLQGRANSGNEWTPAPQPDPIKAIVQFRDQLAKLDIQLLIVPTPLKTTMQPGAVSRRFEGEREPLQNASYAEFLRRLDELKVRYVELGIAMGVGSGTQAPTYLYTDTHWSPTGMALAARAVAREIERMKVLPPVNQPAQYIRRTMAVENHGDIVNMLDFGTAQTLYAAQRVEIEQVLNADQTVWKSAQESNVLVLGDSFSNIFSYAPMNWGESAGFVEHLSAELRWPCDSIVRNAGGSHATRQALAGELRAGRDRLARKKLVIWQFAARDLASGDWKLMELPAVQEEKKVSAAQVGEMMVEAKVRHVSVVPKTNEPYADAVTYTQYEVVKDANGFKNGSTIITVQWVLRKRVLMDAARYKPGEVHRLRIVKYQEYIKAHPEVERIQAVNTLDDIESDVYWAPLITE